MEMYAGGWRSEIFGVAQALGKQRSGGWREDLRFIREYFEMNLQTPNVLLDADGNVILDANGSVFLVR